MALCDDLQVCSIFIGATFLDLILQESYENVRVVVEKLGLEQLYDLMPEDQLKNRMRTKGISVRGYQGGVLDGVNSNLFLKDLDFLLFSVPADAQPVKDMLASFKVVVEG